MLGSTNGQVDSRVKKIKVFQSFKILMIFTILDGILAHGMSHLVILSI
jgi:hypothetical protein